MSATVMERMLQGCVYCVDDDMLDKGAGYPNEKYLMQSGLGEGFTY